MEGRCHKSEQHLLVDGLLQHVGGEGHALKLFEHLVSVHQLEGVRCSGAEGHRDHSDAVLGVHHSTRAVRQEAHATGEEVGLKKRVALKGGLAHARCRQQQPLRVVREVSEGQLVGWRDEVEVIVLVHQVFWRIVLRTQESVWVLLDVVVCGSVRWCVVV